MHKPGRILAGVVGLLLAFDAYLTIRTNAWLPVTIALGAAEATAALMVFWFAALGHVPGERAMFTRVLLVGVTIGAVAFVAGLVGALLYAPGNQSPLVGIFMTGPIGFAAGCAAAFVWTRRRRSVREA